MKNIYSQQSTFRQGASAQSIASQRPLHVDYSLSHTVLSYRKQQIDGTRWRVFHFLNLNSLSLDSCDLAQIASRKMLSFYPSGYVEIAQVVKGLSIHEPILTCQSDQNVVTQVVDRVGLRQVEHTATLSNASGPLVYGRGRFFNIPTVNDASHEVLQEAAPADSIKRENTPA